MAIAFRPSDHSPRLCTSLTNCNGIVELSDGALAATAYGNFKTDNVPIKGFGGKDGIRMYRTYTVRSNDRGKSWVYGSAITHDGMKSMKVRT